MATLLIFVSHFPEKCAPYFQGRKKYVYFGEVMGCKGCWCLSCSLCYPSHPKLWGALCLL